MCSHVYRHVYRHMDSAVLANTRDICVDMDAGVYNRVGTLYNFLDMDEGVCKRVGNS